MPIPVPHTIRFIYMTSCNIISTYQSILAHCEQIRQYHHIYALERQIAGCIIKQLGRASANMDIANWNYVMNVLTSLCLMT